MNVPAAVQKRVEAKLKQGIALCEKKYNKQFKMPRVTYNVNGSTAGLADYRGWHIKLNPVILMENQDDSIDNTVPHEFAHLVCHIVYPQCYEGGITWTRSGRPRRQKRDIHGSYWQSIMRVLGADPSRTHNYDVTNVVRKKASYQYRCTNPWCVKNEQGIFSMGPKRHRQLQISPKSRWHRSCKGYALELIGHRAAGVSPNAPKVLQAKVPPMKLYNTPAVGAVTLSPDASKKDRAIALYKANKDKLFRVDMIELFIKELGMTRAGASTYYYTCQKAS